MHWPYGMESDVIPDCAQEVDPLGSVENCIATPSENNTHVGASNAQVRASEPFSIKASNKEAITSVQCTVTSGSHKMPKELAQQSKIQKNQPAAIRKQMPRTNERTTVTASTTAHTTTATLSATQMTTATLTCMPTTASTSTLSSSSSSASSSSSSSVGAIGGSSSSGGSTPKVHTNSSGNTNCASATTTTANTKPSQSPPKSTPAQVSTMHEVLSSLPGFNVKSRRRPYKKMSTAAQIEQTREGCIDLETPDSILVGTNLRDLLNKDTFSLLPPLYQYKLVQLLPNVDRPPNIDEPDVKFDPAEPIRLNPSSLTNEFFARACLQWRDRLAEGKFVTNFNTQHLNKMSIQTQWMMIN